MNIFSPKKKDILNNNDDNKNKTMSISASFRNIKFNNFKNELSSHRKIWKNVKYLFLNERSQFVKDT